MKRTSIIFTCLFVLGAVIMLIPSAQAYKFYSDDIGATGGCAQCHGAFNSGVPYTSLVDGVSWGVDLHTGHLNGTDLEMFCEACHFGFDTTGDQVNLSSSSFFFPPASCTGCHGRIGDINAVNQNGYGVGAGLRQHHFNASTTDCLACHADADPAAFTPLREDAWPEYYWWFTSNTPPYFWPLDPCNKGEIQGVENFAGSPRGLDNDGDLIYDVAENECQPGTCGNGILDAGEICDDGYGNGLSGPCGCQIDCTFPSAGTSCGVGEFCRSEGTCDGSGYCAGRTTNTCDDGIGCTDDSCDEVNDTCVNTGNDANCADDGQFCTGVEYCDAISDCSATGDPCQPGETCNEGTETCDQPVCGNGTVETGETCDDGATNGTTTCGCQTGCTLPPVGTSCSDGAFCNGDETCDGVGSCQSGTQVVCDDGIGCTDDSCDEVNDTCASAANDVNCPDDGQFCTGTEFCDPVNDCSATGDPCQAGETCDETNDICFSCAYYTTRGTCNDDPSCEWSGSPKNGTCQDAVVCVPDETPEATCTDGVDNDCDGLTDCADTADCGSDPACQGGSCDTYSDKGTCNDDPNCEWAGSPQNGTCQDAVACVPDETPEATCTDGIDNDCDSMTDCADTADCGGDPACQGGSCDTYTDKTSCQSNGCTWSNKDKVCM